MTSHYAPMFSSASLPPVPMPDPKFVKPKFHTAALYEGDRAKAHTAWSSEAPLALVYHGTVSRWYMHKTGKTVDELLTLTPAILRRWRIIDTRTGLIREQG